MHWYTLYLILIAILIQSLVECEENDSKEIEFKHPAFGRDEQWMKPKQSKNQRANRTQSLIVDTSHGRVLGRPYTKHTNAFLGIPYAEPPLNSLRFRPPRPKTPWYPHIYRATHFGKECLQSELYSGQAEDSSSFTSAEHRHNNDNSNNKNNIYNTEKGEDCLFLNIFQPKHALSSREKLPVLIWIYGGAFLHGGASRSDYDGSVLAEKNVIVVTFNYRVGAFGFLVSVSDGIYGNYGLADQKLAIQWVVDNIGRFGGDTDRITLFGESAGAMSVGLHLLDQQLASQYATERLRYVDAMTRRPKQKLSITHRTKRHQIDDRSRRNKKKSSIEQYNVKSWEDVYHIMQKQSNKVKRTTKEPKLNNQQQQRANLSNANYGYKNPQDKGFRQFQSIIMQSNPIGYRYRSITVANFLGRALKELLDCEDLQCLQSETAEEIVHVQDTLMAVPRSIGDFFTWGPVLTDHAYLREIRRTHPFYHDHDDRIDAHTQRRDELFQSTNSTINKQHQTLVSRKRTQMNRTTKDSFRLQKDGLFRREDRLPGSRLHHNFESFDRNRQRRAHFHPVHALEYGKHLNEHSFVHRNSSNSSDHYSYGSFEMYENHWEEMDNYYLDVANITVRQPIDTLRTIQTLQDTPVILGVNKHEGNVFVFTAFPARMNKFIFQLLIFSFFRTAAPEILKLYHPYIVQLTQTSMYPDYRLILSQILGDYLFKCANQHLAGLLTAAGAAVYLYEFALPTRTPGYPCCDGLSCHSCEIPYVFGLQDSIHMDYRFQSGAHSNKASSTFNWQQTGFSSSHEPYGVDDTTHRILNQGHFSDRAIAMWRHVSQWFASTFHTNNNKGKEGDTDRSETTVDVGYGNKNRYQHKTSETDHYDTSTDELADIHVSRLMTSYWTNFAAHGDPNGPIFFSISDYSNDGDTSSRHNPQQPTEYKQPWWPRLMGDLSAFQQLRQVQEHAHHRKRSLQTLTDDESTINGQIRDTSVVLKSGHYTEESDVNEAAPAGLWKYLADTDEPHENEIIHIFDDVYEEDDDFFDQDQSGDHHRLGSDNRDKEERDEDGYFQQSQPFHPSPSPSQSPTQLPPQETYSWETLKEKEEFERNKSHDDDSEEVQETVETYRRLMKRLRELSLTSSEDDPRYAHYMDKLSRIKPADVDVDIDIIKEVSEPLDNSAVAPDKEHTRSDSPKSEERTNRKLHVNNAEQGSRHQDSAADSQCQSSNNQNKKNSKAFAFIQSQQFMHQMVFDSMSAVYVIENDCICSAWTNLGYKF